MSTTPALVTDKPHGFVILSSCLPGRRSPRARSNRPGPAVLEDGPGRSEWLRYKLSIVECRALEKTARGLTEAATEQARLRGVTREIADFAATQMKGSIDSAAQTTRQLLEDVQASLHEAIAGDAILRAIPKRRGSILRPLSNH